MRFGASGLYVVKLCEVMDKPNTVEALQDNTGNMRNKRRNARKRDTNMNLLNETFETQDNIYIKLSLKCKWQSPSHQFQ